MPAARGHVAFSGWCRGGAGAQSDGTRVDTGIESYLAHDA